MTQRPAPAINNARSNQRCCRRSDRDIAVRRRHKMYWMDGKWKSDEINNDSQQYSKTGLNKKYFILLDLLLELLPSMQKDMVELILLFICYTDISINKYVLLDISKNNVQFLIKHLKSNQLIETTTIQITLNAFSKQLLNKINNRYKSSNKNIACSVYFHNNYNALINEQYFILTVLNQQNIKYQFYQNDTDDINNKYCHILCKLQSNSSINMLQEICIPFYKFTSFSNQNNSHYGPNIEALKGFDIKFDGNYVYAAKENMLSLMIFNKNAFHVNKINPKVLSLPEPKSNNILFYELYDRSSVLSLLQISKSNNEENDDNNYLMVSREKCSKIELYQIEKDKLSVINEFDLAHIFREMNHEYHDKYDKDGSSGYNGDDHGHNIFAFSMKDNNILCCIYYNSSQNRLFVANIELSPKNNAKLINYELLDGKIGNVCSTTSMWYGKCFGIETIYHDDGDEDLLIFCQKTYRGCFGGCCKETEFRINANSLKVIYGKHKKIDFYSDYNYRKQLSVSKFVL